MNNNLTTTNQNAKLALSKSKSLLNITNSLLANRPNNELFDSLENLRLSGDAILNIDTGGHMALIREIIVTKNGDIISASDDKTIRIWSSRDGKEKRKIVGQIGSGSKGKIYAIALSSDEKYLAVAGFLTGETNEEISSIRLYDYHSGKLLVLLKSHANIVNDLAFSEDVRYLASASGDTTVKIWDMANFNVAKTIRLHTSDVFGVKFASNTTIISAGDDNRIALYTISGERINEYIHNEKLRFIATNGITIAACGKGNEILFFDMNLKKLSIIKSETVPSGLVYSPRGRYLMSGFSFNYKKQNDKIYIYDNQNNYTCHAAFDKHTNLTGAVAWLNDDTAVSGGGENHEIYIWDIKSQNIKTKIVGAGQIVWGVGIDGKNIAWGNVFDAKNQNVRGTLQKSINLKTLAITSVTSQSTFYRINSDGLTHSAGGDYGKSDAILTIKSTNTSITKDAYTGYRHNCYGWYKDYIISGGTNGHLKIYDTKGVEVASLMGHTGEILSIALDGDRLVSGSSDQTIKVWNLSKLKIWNRELQYDEDIINKVIQATNWTRKEVIANADFIKEKTEASIYKNNSIAIYPLLSLFVGNDDECVMWTDEGYYNASAKGDRFINWHINQGSDKEALSYPVGRFKEKYYQPELFALLLDGYTMSDALEKCATKETTKNIDIDEDETPF